MEKPPIESRQLVALERVSASINSLARTLEGLYQDWKNPIQTVNEQMEPMWEKHKQENRFQEELSLLKEQNKTLVTTVKISVTGLLITALAATADILLRVYVGR